MLLNRIQAAIVAIVLLLMYIFTNSKTALALLAMFAVLLLVSLILFFVSSRGLAVGLKCPYVITAGEEKKIAISLGKIRGVNVWTRIRIKNAAYRSQTKYDIYAFPDSTSGNVSFDPGDMNTGKYLITAEKTKVLDMLGVFSKRLPDPPQKELFVYPDLMGISLKEIPYSETMDDGTIYSQEKKGKDVTEVFAMREYVPGDDLRSVHWKLSSKTDSLMVRDFAQPLNRSLVILLDLKAAGVSEAAFAKAIDIAVSVSSELVFRGVRHTLVWYDEGLGDFTVREIDSADRLADTVPSILSAQGGERAETVFSMFERDAKPAGTVRLYYISPNPDIGLLCDKARMYAMTVIGVKDKEAGMSIETLPFDFIEVDIDADTAII